MSGQERFPVERWQATFLGFAATCGGNLGIVFA
jgi:hypothetical protein